MPAADNPKDDELDALAARFHDGEAGAARPAAPPLLDDPARISPADSGMSAGEALDEDGFSAGELRRTQLGQRLAKRRGYSVAAQEKKTRRLFSSWGVGGVLLLSAWSLASTAPDVRYWLSNAPAIDLGHMGGYHLERAREGAFAHVEGIASPKRGTYSRMLGEHELVPLIASRILVDRARAPDESLRGFGFTYSGEGRLVRAEEGGKWDAVRGQFVEAGELARAGDVWVLEEGVSPHRGWRTPLEVAAWALVCLVCAAVLVRRARRAASS